MSAYSDAVLALSPVAYWRLGEATGATAYDETTNHDGSYVNTPTLGENSLIVSDPDNTAVFFERDNTEYVSVPHSAALTFTGTFSLIAWCKSTSKVDWETIVAKFATPTKDGYMLDRKQTSGLLRFCTWRNGSQYTLDGTSDCADGDPHFVCATFSNGVGRIYVDGAEENNNLSMGVPLGNGTGAFMISYRPDFAAKQDGTLDEVAVFNYVLSGEEISNLYEIATTMEQTAGVATCGSGCVATYKSIPGSPRHLSSVEVSGLGEGKSIKLKAYRIGGNSYEDVVDENGEIDLLPYDIEFDVDAEGTPSEVVMSAQFMKGS